MHVTKKAQTGLLYLPVRPIPGSPIGAWVLFFPLHMSSEIEGNSKSFVFDCGQIKQPFPEERNRGFFDEG